MKSKPKEEPEINEIEFAGLCIRSTTSTLKEVYDFACLLLDAYKDILLGEQKKELISGGLGIG